MENNHLLSSFPRLRREKEGGWRVGREREKAHLLRANEPTHTSSYLSFKISLYPPAVTEFLQSALDVS